MKTLTVEKLIELLSNVDPKAEIVLEGCDCAADCIGYSVGEDAYKGQIILRQVRGAFDSDDLGILTEV